METQHSLDSTRRKGSIFRTCTSNSTNLVQCQWNHKCRYFSASRMKSIFFIMKGWRMKTFYHITITLSRTPPTCSFHWCQFCVNCVCIIVYLKGATPTTGRMLSLIDCWGENDWQSVMIMDERGMKITVWIWSEFPLQTLMLHDAWFDVTLEGHYNIIMYATLSLKPFLIRPTIFNCPKGFKLSILI